MFGSVLLILTVIYGVWYFRAKRTIPKYDNQLIKENWNYGRLLNFVKSNDIPLPAMIIDQTILNRNIDFVISTVAGTGKTVRVATKSIRCVHILKHIFERCNHLGLENVFKGLMCFSVKEAEYLSEEGFDDFFIAYPTLQRSDIETAVELTRKGKTICLTVDSIICVKVLDEIVQQVNSSRTKNKEKNVKLAVAVDLDMRFNMGIIKLGAHRSNIDERNLSKYEPEYHMSQTTVLDCIFFSTYLQFKGIMGYEAHVAGLPDKSPSTGLIPGFVVRYLKGLFYRQAASRRAYTSRWCKNEGVSVAFFNGSGSGNFEEALSDPSLTEVTVGSAFLQGQLFDNFATNKCLPAMCFGLQVTRRNVNEKYISCQSGGFIASGSVADDKCPTPFCNPTDLVPFSDEGYGEVQTPLKTTDVFEYKLGDPVFFRPAKSGEIAEHFEEYIIKKGYRIVHKAKTYRGAGFRFF